MVGLKVISNRLVEKGNGLVEGSTDFETQDARSFKIYYGLVVELVDALDSDGRFKADKNLSALTQETGNVEPPKFGEGFPSDLFEGANAEPSLEKKFSRKV